MCFGILARLDSNPVRTALGSTAQSGKRAMTGKPFKPAVESFWAPSPEVSLCYHFIHEAIYWGWRCIPEYPRSRFDIFMIAEEWVSTKGAAPGMQVGVQAKTGFTNPLMQQLKKHITNQKRWNNPEYIVGLIPQILSGPHAKKKLLTLKQLGIGLFTAYDTFNGNEHEDTAVSVNLADMSKFGQRHIFPGRVIPPRPDYPFTTPGSVGGQHWSPWKEKAMNLVVDISKRGGEIFLKDFVNHKVDHKRWIIKGWVTRTGEHRGKVDVYKLNPESPKDRVDLQHPWEFKRRLLL